MDKKNIDRHARWKTVRVQGKKQFVLKTGVLGWGITTGVLWAIMMSLTVNAGRFIPTLITALITFPIGGYFYGAWLWDDSEKKYLKYIEENGEITLEAPTVAKGANNFFLTNLRWYEHLAAGWPLILILVGGAIGGGCGGAAYALNGKIFSLSISKPLKYLYVALVGIGAVILYIMIAIILFILFPQLAHKHG